LKRLFVARRGDASCPDTVRLGGARTAARGLLWVCVALVFVRGLADIASGPDGTRVGSRWTRQALGDEARAFAVAFARSYLTVPQPAELERFFADGLRDRASAIVSPHSPGVQVTQATVAREVSLGSSRALFTVAALTSDGHLSYLAVPVAMDGRGGLAVDDLPAFAAPPRRGSVAVQAPAVLSGAEEDAIGGLVRRFLSAYLDGEPDGAFGYLLAPGAQIAPMASGLRLLAVDELAEEQGAAGRRVVVATVRVRASHARAIYTQRYRLTVVRRDRWYVAAVAGGPGA
jgi:Conjugative transposon protein TcpC